MDSLIVDGFLNEEEFFKRYDFEALPEDYEDDEDDYPVQEPYEDDGNYGFDDEYNMQYGGKDLEGDFDIVFELTYLAVRREIERLETHRHRHRWVEVLQEVGQLLSTKLQSGLHEALGTAKDAYMCAIAAYPLLMWSLDYPDSFTIQDVEEIIEWSAANGGLIASISEDYDILSLFGPYTVPLALFEELELVAGFFDPDLVAIDLIGRLTYGDRNLRDAAHILASLPNIPESAKEVLEGVINDTWD